MNLWLIAVFALLVSSYIVIINQSTNYAVQTMQLLLQRKQYFYLTEGLFACALTHLKQHPNKTVLSLNKELEFRALEKLFKGLLCFSEHDARYDSKDYYNKNSHDKYIDLTCRLYHDNLCVYTLNYRLKALPNNNYEIIYSF